LFKENQRKHALILTTHGVHQWTVTPGLQDTGGQNIFVNQFAEELACQGWKISIVNRGGYPHPITGELQIGIDFADEHRRLIYLEDGLPEFVRKEDMDTRVEHCVIALNQVWENEDNFPIDLVISNYWDAASIAQGFLSANTLDVPHIWVPHSLGTIKKRNVIPEKWGTLKIKERIFHESKILSSISWAASTSPIISQALVKDYGFQEDPLWLPPCIQEDRYYPRTVIQDARIWKTLSESSGLPEKEIQHRKIITEISRTDTTKRKDILIKAYAQIIQKHPDTLLAITIDPEQEPVGKALLSLIDELGIRESIAVLGSIWDVLPELYAVSYVYCTPSIMEGFGMSAQEAAATGVPVIASNLVPFVTEYLQDNAVEIYFDGSEEPMMIAEGSIVIEPDNVAGFAEALDRLLTSADLRDQTGKAAYTATIPQFTWKKVVANFLESLQ